MPSHWASECSSILAALSSLSRISSWGWQERIALSPWIFCDKVPNSLKLLFRDPGSHSSRPSIMETGCSVASNTLCRKSSSFLTFLAESKILIKAFVPGKPYRWLALLYVNQSTKLGWSQRYSIRQESFRPARSGSTTSSNKKTKEFLQGLGWVILVGGT